jgi:hypothetical protein
MFESRDRLLKDVAGLLDALRERGDGRYAAVFDAKSVVAESPRVASTAGRPFRLLVEGRGAELLRVPAALHSGEAMTDVFDPWTSDEFLLAVVNGRVGVLVACAEASRLEADSGRLLRALVDRLLRLEPAWRYDERGRGLFFGSPRLDTVVIPRPGGDPISRDG